MQLSQELALHPQRRGLARALTCARRVTQTCARVAAAVHYTTWAEASGEEVENTRESREAVQIIVAHGAPLRCAASARAPTCHSA